MMYGGGWGTDETRPQEGKNTVSGTVLLLLLALMAAPLATTSAVALA
jgi:hypothetical protein